jgi:hypothetical protein
VKIPFIDKLRKKDESESEQFTASMSGWLMRDHNMKPEDAFKMSKEFWKKYKNKLKESISY